ncbi:MAG: CBS domain-containing protein, partial [Methyloprofundus sp.]|nr:CBS domain-containing protein [Methyloprofundus sp.]
VLIMLLLRCLHPPGSATALTPVLSGDSLTSLGFSLVLFPVVINVGIMLLMSLLINRWLMHREYPIHSPPQKIAIDHKSLNPPSVQLGISEADFNQALDESNTFVDVSHTEIRNLLLHAEKYRYQRIHKTMLCTDIMNTSLLTVAYGTDVEEAWQMMQQHNLKAIPVIDKARRVIGIVTWHDFFKFINLSSYDSFQDKFRTFIRRTAKIETNKPESIGHIMTKSVITLSEDTPIVELVPLMSTTGLRQIPIVNKENRLVGMVYQAHLIAALYNQKMA